MSYLGSVRETSYNKILLGKTDTNIEKHNKSIRISLFNNKAIALAVKDLRCDYLLLIIL